MIIKIALVFLFGLLVYKKSTWHYFPDPNTSLVKSEVKEIKDYDVVKIYQELNGMQQNDSFLIDFIKNNVLIKPDNLPLKLSKMEKDEDLKYSRVHDNGIFRFGRNRYRNKKSRYHIFL